MKYVLAFLTMLLTLMFIFSAGCTDATNNTIRVGIVENNAPWTYINENGEYTGFDVESVKWIAKQNDLEVEFVPLTWANIVDNVADGTVDIIYSSLLISPERGEIIDFTVPYFTSNIAIAVRSDSTLTKEDIMSGNYPVAVMSAGAAHKYALEHIDSSKVFNSDINGAFEMLKAGTVEAVISEEVGINRHVRSGPYKNIGVVPVSEYQAVAVRKGDTKTRDMFDEGINNLRSSVEWQRLMSKYNLP